ncbi:MAG: hypothetical protein LBB45_02325, partial [Methanobrevibacter sp.]|nr:hypothetical protein [Candidatus Methanovirga basalitermitum]
DGGLGGAGGKAGTSNLNALVGASEDAAPEDGGDASSSTGGAGGNGASVGLTQPGVGFIINSIFVQGGNGGNGGNAGNGTAGNGGNGGSASLVLSFDTNVTDNVNVFSGYGGTTNDGSGGIDMLRFNWATW